MITGYTPKASHRSGFTWREAIHGLAEKLDFRNLPESKSRESLREDFYKSFLSLSVSAALIKLRDSSWKGDRFHDAEEIAAECANTLLSQERQSTGPFAPGPKGFAGDALRGYLNRLIWRGISQKRTNLLRKRARWTQLDESLFDIASSEYDAEGLWQDVEVVRERLDANLPGKYRTASGLTPLDSVIAKALADAGEKELLLKEGAHGRSWQRWEKEAREALQKQLVNSPIRTRTDGRRVARRVMTSRREAQALRDFGDQATIG